MYHRTAATTLLTSLVCTAGLLYAATGFAQQTSGLDGSEKMAMAKEKKAVESQARQTIQGLFRRLCPGRCELVEIKANMSNPQPVAGVEPGFGAGAGSAFDVEAKSVDVTVLLDSKLPSNFRQNIPRMIQYQLHDLAPAINVRPESLDFPEPQNRPSPPDQQDRRRTRPMPPKMPKKKAEPEPKEQKQEEQKEKAADEKEQKPGGFWAWIKPFLEELAPWIGPILMMIVLFLLAMPMLRRLSEMTERPGSGVGVGGASDRGEPGPDVEKLRAELTRSRAVKNRVLRRWLEESVEGVADLVRLLGPEILEDVKSDGSLDSEIEEVSEIVARHREPLSDEEIQRVCNEAHARINSARLLHEEQGLAADWEFLEGISVATLRRILRPLETREKLHVVGQLPPTLRSSFLESLDGEDRRELFLAAGSEELSKQASMALAARLRKSADEYGHVGSEAEGQAALVIDMLDSLLLEQQEQTLRELGQTRPEIAEAVKNRICLESACLHVPREVIADAVHRTPVEPLANFLRKTREDVRKHVLDVAPSQKRDALHTELSLEVPVGKTEFLEARERFMDVVQNAIRREGHDLVQANDRALRGASSNSTSKTSEASV